MDLSNKISFMVELKDNFVIHSDKFYVCMYYYKMASNNPRH